MSSSDWSQSRFVPRFLRRSSSGCAAAPNPRPVGHDVFWDARKVVGVNGDDRLLQGAWSIDGPMAGGCDVQVLDCGDEANWSREITFDALAPFASASVRCPRGGSSDRYVVFNGTACDLYRPDNFWGCYWVRHR